MRFFIASAKIGAHLLNESFRLRVQKFLVLDEPEVDVVVLFLGLYLDLGVRGEANTESHVNRAVRTRNGQKTFKTDLKLFVKR